MKSGKCLRADKALKELLGFRHARRLVQHQPIEAKLAADFHERIEIDERSHIPVGAQTITLDAVAVFVGRGKHDDREEFGAVVGTYTAQQAQIAPEVNAFRKQVIKGLDAVGRNREPF